MCASEAELPPLRDVIARYGLRTRKSLGQHFLLDANLTDKIVRLAGDVSGHCVVEVGPGPGGLTRSILAAGAPQVIVLEKDARCIPALQELQAFADGRLTIVEGDATETPVAQLGDAPRRLISNLPYNVGTELLVGWLHDVARDAGVYASMTLMFQQEVAERICAVSGTKAYGRISILAQWLCEVRPVLRVPAAAFSPPPKVDSAVVQLVPRATPLHDVPIGLLEKVVAIAFQQRRKMLRSALKPLSADIEAWCKRADIDSALRPDQLTVAQYCALARTL